MRILLFGKDGQVGWELQRSLSLLGEVTALGSAGGDGLHGDFREPGRLAATVVEVRPDVIVNAAAYTAVDRAESEQATAGAVNAEAPGVLAKAAAAAGAAFVHFSTDYVFDGSGDRPWHEDDAPAPLNVYGRTKLEGERLVRLHCPQHLILRTSWVYGARGGNFAKTMVRLAGERDRLTVIDDQHGAPTGADLLADVAAHAIRALRAKPELAGLYHVAAAGETTWNGYARFVIGEALRYGMALKAAPDRVEPVPSSSFQTAARRPLNSRLDTRRLTSAFGLVMPPWQSGVARMLQEVVGLQGDKKA